MKSKTNVEERRVRHLEVESDERNGSLEGLYVETIQGSSRRNIQSDLLVNDTHVTFKLDTGAECNIMSMHLASELNARIEPTSMLLKSFGGHQLDTVGTCAGIEKSKANARVTVFWPGMTKDIEELVSSCEKCMKYQSKQPKEPMQTRDVPFLPWQTVASDILEHKNQKLSCGY